MSIEIKTPCVYADVSNYPYCAGKITFFLSSKGYSPFYVCENHKHWAMTASKEISEQEYIKYMSALILK